MQKPHTLSLFFFLLYFISSAQVINKGDLFISKDGSLKIGSPFLNKGSLYNDGVVWMANDFDNLGDYDYLENEESLTMFKSDQGFKIKGNALYLADVLFDVPFLLISSDLYIFNFAEFHKGIVNTDNQSMLFFGDKANSLSHTKSFFTGKVNKQDGHDFTFPIGKDLVYAAVTIEDIKANESVSIEYNIGNTDALLSHKNKHQDILKISPDHYWSVDLLNNQSINITEFPLIENNELKISNSKNKRAVLFLDNDQWVALESTLTSNGTGVLANITESGKYTLGIVESSDNSTLPVPPNPPTVITKDIEVYQGITANNDGANDYLIIDNIEKYPLNKVTVFNRAGQEVYTTRGYHNSLNYWDATYKGNQLQGTFFYVVSYKDAKGKEREVTGFIHVK